MQVFADARADLIPIYKTQNLSEAQRHLYQESRRATLEVTHPRLFRGFSSSFTQLGRIGLSMTTIASPEGHELSYRPDSEYCLNLPLTGQGWLVSNQRVEEIKHGQAALITPCGQIHKHWLGPSRVLTVHIPSEIFENQCITTGTAGVGALTVLDCPDITTLIDLIKVICGETPKPSVAVRNAEIAGHLEKTILAFIAQMLPQVASEAASETKSPAIPYYVRRAERFMRANFRPGVSLDEIADAAGVSRRTLQYGFKTYHRTTPMHFFKKLRLAEARAVLERGNCASTLTNLAFDLGYVNASHFTSDYREMFGETPSRTAAKSLSNLNNTGAELASQF